MTSLYVHRLTLIVVGVGRGSDPPPDAVVYEFQSLLNVWIAWASLLADM